MRNNSTILLIAFLVFLASCSAEKKSSSVSFKVTNSMMVSNSGYQGGLVIQGEGPGAKFSQFIPYSASTTSGVDLQLPKGIWKFRAFGWTGGTAMVGALKCAESVVDVNLDTVDVNLAPTLAACDNMLGSSTYMTSPGSGVFKTLNFITCGQFYKVDGTVVSSYMDSGFCNETSTLPASSKVWAKSIQIIPINYALDGTRTEITNAALCFTGSQGFATVSANIPTKNFPISVKLFDNATCDSTDQQDLLVDYKFVKGLEYDYLSETSPLLVADKRLFTGSSQNYLFLSSSKSKQGLSSLRSLIPSIKCGTGQPCIEKPSLSSIDYLIAPGNRYLLQSNASLTQRCDTFTITGLTSADYECIEEIQHDKVDVYLIISSSVCATSCSYDWGFGSTSNSLNVFNSISNPLPEFYNDLFRTIGSFNTTTVLTNVEKNISSLSNIEQDYGRLSSVREMLDADGPGGLLGNTPCSSTVNASQVIAFYEDGEIKTYKISFTGLGTNVVQVPKYICDDTNLNPTNCTSAGATYKYDAVLKIQILNGLIWETRNYIKLSCAKKIGEMEQQESDADGLRKELTFWNTQDIATSRYEYYSREEKIDPTTAEIQNAYISFERGEKTSLTDLRVDLFNFNSKKIATDEYKQHIRQSYYDITVTAGAKKVIRHSRFEELPTSSDENGSITLSSPAYSLFEDTLYSDFESQGLGLSSHNAKSANGTNKVRTFYNSTNNIYITGSLTNGFSRAGTIQKIKSSINNSGQLIVCWLEGNATPYSVYSAVYDGSTWSSVNSHSNGGDTINCHMDSTGRPYVVYHNSSTQNGYITSINDASSWTTPVALAASNNISFDSTILNDLIYTAEIYNNASPIESILKITKISFDPSTSTFTPISLTYNLTASTTVSTGIIEFAKISGSGNLRLSANYNVSAVNYLTIFESDFTGSSIDLMASYNTNGGVHIPSKDKFSSWLNVTAPVALNTPTAVAPFVSTNVGSLALPIKTQFEYNFSSMRPDNFDLIFTPQTSFVGQ